MCLWQKIWAIFFWKKGNVLKTKEFWDKVYYITHHSDLKDNLTNATIQNQRFDWLSISPTISTFVNFTVIMPNKHLVKLGNQQLVIKLFTSALCLISSSFWFIRFYVVVEVEPYVNGGGRAIKAREACNGWERESKEKNIPIFWIRDRYGML